MKAKNIKINKLEMLSRLVRTSLSKNFSAPVTARFFGSSHDHHVKADDRNDATSTFFESVSSTLKGITHVNYIVEHDPNLTEADKAGKKRFLIYRYNPMVR